MSTLKDKTPPEFVCAVAACPAVFETDDGRLVLVAKRAGAQIKAAVPASRIGEDEILVEIPKSLLRLVRC